MKSERGFTLVEIIVSISLIVIVGSSVAIFSVYSKKENNKTLETYKDRIHQAVSVYLETNKEAKKEVLENNNGAVIPLKTLENQGLIEFDKNVNINNDYVVAILGSSTNDTSCVNGTELIDSWSLSSKTIYICLDKSKITSTSSDLKESLLGNDGYYIARGSNPNNWVEFPVTSNSSQEVYFPEEDKDLWRIVSIDNNGEIRLIYNRNIMGSKFNYYYNVFLDSPDNKTTILENNIEYKNFIIISRYFWRYSNYYYDEREMYLYVKELKLGTISSKEYYNTIINGNSWIYIENGDAILIGQGITLSSTGLGEIRDGYASYRPVVTLDAKVKLIKNNDNCNGKLGSKGCPYKLECSDCNN